MLLKRISKYNNFEKAGGSIVKNIKIGSRTLNAKESAKMIIQYYQRTHSVKYPSIELVTSVEFPDLPRLESVLNVAERLI